MGILVVEVDGAIRHPLSEYLRECGYRVFEAVDTDEAMTIVSGHRDLVSIVICDVQSRGTIGGFGFAKWLREHAPEIQLALGASSERAVKQAVDFCREGPVLNKPYDHQILLDRIKQAVAKRNRARVE